MNNQPETKAGTDAESECIAAIDSRHADTNGLEEKSHPKTEATATTVAATVNASIPTVWRRTSSKHPLKPLRKRACAQRAELLVVKPPPEPKPWPSSSDVQVAESQSSPGPCEEIPGNQDSQDDWSKPVPCADTEAWPTDALSPDRLTLLRQYDLRLCYMCAETDTRTDENQCQPEQLHQDEQVVTTLVLWNIPSYYTKDALIAELEALCLQDSWDFLNLPVDASTQWSVGCAYINCRTPEHANIARAVLKGHSWFQGGGHVAAEVTDAVLQGYDVNVQHSRLTPIPRTVRYPEARPVVVNYEVIHPPTLPSDALNCTSQGLPCRQKSQVDECKPLNREARTISIAPVASSERENSTAKPASWAIVKDATEESGNRQGSNLHARVQPSTVGTDSAETMVSPLGLEWPTLGA